MNLPLKDSRRYKILVNFMKSGAMTISQFIAEHSLMGFGDELALKGEISYLRSTGVLTLSGNRYKANVDFSEFEEFTKDVVPSRTPKEFTEINSKHMLPKVSPRGQQIREISFIGLGASQAIPNFSLMNR